MSVKEVPTAQGQSRMQSLADNPLLVFVVSFIALWLCAQLGAALRRKQEAYGGHAPETFTLILTASLTLLGLIVGFTFSMAVSRYDQRKNCEAEEANAIGTEYVRSGLLPAADAARTRTLLRSYLDQRILLYHSGDEQRRSEIRQRIAELQRELWSVAQNAALAQPSALTALVAAGQPENGIDAPGHRVLDRYVLEGLLDAPDVYMRIERTRRAM